MPGRIKFEPEEAAVSVTASITGASIIGSIGLPATAADAATANAVARAIFFILLPRFSQNTIHGQAKDLLSTISLIYPIR